MGLKTQTHTGQANPNIKAQANTLSAKPLSPFKPKSAVKPSQTKPVPQTQTEPKSQTVGLSKAKQSQTKEPTLIPLRRQFIEQYGAYALVTPVALYAMMSPNRAMAQAASVGVIADDAVAAARPTVLNDQDRIENFDINTKTDGIIDSDGDLSLGLGEKYIAPDGVTYTCVINNGCIISPTAGGGGYANWSSTFTITYPVADDPVADTTDDAVSTTDDAADTTDAAADTTDDAADPVVAVDDDPVAEPVVAEPVVVDRRRFIGRGGRMATFSLATATRGGAYRGTAYTITQNGVTSETIQLSRNQKYTAPDGIVYTCTTRWCVTIGRKVEHGTFSYIPK